MLVRLLEGDCNIRARVVEAGVGYYTWIVNDLFDLVSDNGAHLRLRRTILGSRMPLASLTARLMRFM